MVTSEMKHITSADLLIMPAVICLSQRLSHACLGASLTELKRVLLIKSQLIYWTVNSYSDNCGNSGA